MNRGQIARTDNLAGMHASVLMTSREHSDETGRNGRTHVNTHTTRACSHGDKVPVEGTGCRREATGSPKYSSTTLLSDLFWVHAVE